MKWVLPRGDKESSWVMLTPPQDPRCQAAVRSLLPSWSALVSAVLTSRLIWVALIFPSAPTRVGETFPINLRGHLIVPNVNFGTAAGFGPRLAA